MPLTGGPGAHGAGGHVHPDPSFLILYHISVFGTQNSVPSSRPGWFVLLRLDSRRPQGGAKGQLFSRWGAGHEMQLTYAGCGEQAPDQSPLSLEITPEIMF